MSDSVAHPRSGRPSAYTPEQDDIILSTPHVDEVNRKFLELGYEPKSAAAIHNRRHYLRKRLASDGASDIERDRQLSTLMMQRRRLRRELERVSQRRAQLVRELQETEASIRELVADEFTTQDNGDGPSPGHDSGVSE